MNNGTAFIIGFICTIFGWKAKEKFDKSRRPTRPPDRPRNTEGGVINSNPRTNADFYGGIGKITVEPSNIF